ncbi:MAG: hypothetical protein QW379_10375 [Thermoplasmata archaeon]
MLVEGARDVAALRKLGVRGRILMLNRGQGLLRRCEVLAREHGRVILLTDWDLKGRELHERLKKLLAACGGVPDETFWLALRRLCGGSNRTIEELPSFLRNLRETAGAASPIDS